MKKLLVLLEAPYIPFGYNDSVWVYVDVQYHDALGGITTYPNKYIPYAASIIVDLSNRKVRKALHSHYLNRSVDEKYVEILELSAIKFDRNNLDWKSKLKPPTLTTDNVNTPNRQISEEYTTFTNHLVSTGLKSTGLKGNVAVDISTPDETCETC